jgi:hypothetical protein
VDLIEELPEVKCGKFIKEWLSGKNDAASIKTDKNSPAQP